MNTITVKGQEARQIDAVPHLFITRDSKVFLADGTPKSVNTRKGYPAIGVGRGVGKAGKMFTVSSLLARAFHVPSLHQQLALAFQAITNQEYISNAAAKSLAA